MRILNARRNEFDEQKRVEIYKQLDEILTRDCPQINLIERGDVYAAIKGRRHFVRIRLYFYVVNQFHSIHLMAIVSALNAYRRSNQALVRRVQDMQKF